MISDSDRDAALRFGWQVTRAEAAVVDAGLRAYVLRVYNYMVLGLAITGFAALGTYRLSMSVAPAFAVEMPGTGVTLTDFGAAVFTTPLKWLVILAPLGLIWLLSSRVGRMSTIATRATFCLYAALVGIWLGAIFIIFARTSLVQVFFVTAASFAALSFWGYTAQRELSRTASFLIMALSGIVIAALVNAVSASSQLQLMVCVAGVLVFAGLTAWDTGRLKTEYVRSAIGGDVAERSAVMGALSLYLNFVNMFIVLVALLGWRK